ncbi:MAG: hypothetical protein LBS96_07570 [Oscillospiraceae bacterium]|jgi:hypothetical protein|nr:hypothetical protein [Oscillospiraceae bacterium]
MKTKGKTNGEARKVIAALLALLLIVSLFAACKPKSVEDSPENTGPAEAVDTPNKGWNPIVPNDDLTEPTTTDPAPPRALSQEELLRIAAEAVNAARQGQSIPAGQTVPVWDGDLASLTDSERKLVEDKVKADTGVDLTIDANGTVKYPPVTQPSTQPAGATNPAGASAASSSPGSTAAPSGGAKSDTAIRPPVAETIGGGNLSLADQTQPAEKPAILLAGAQRSKLVTFGSSSGHQRFRAVAATQNGGYVVAALVDGTAPGAPAGYTEYFSAIIQYSPEGKVEWTKYFGGNGAFLLAAITVLKDGSIVAVGSTSATNLEAPTHAGTDTDAVVIKLSGSGDKIWLKTFTGSLTDEFVSVAATPDGGFVVGGRTVSADGDFDGLIAKVMQVGTGGTFEKDAIKAIAIKMDKDGNVYGKRVMTGSKDSSFIALAVEPSTGDIYAAVRTAASDYDFANIVGLGQLGGVMIRFNKNLEAYWLKPFAGNSSESITGLAPASGGVVAVGYISAPSYGSGSFSGNFGANFTRLGGRDAVALKYNSDGTVAWIRSLGDTTDDEATGVAAIEGGFVVTGTTKKPVAEQAFLYDWMNYTYGGGDLDSFAWVLRDDGAPVKFIPVSGNGTDALYATGGKGRTFVLVGSSPSSNGFMEGASPVSASPTGGHVGLLALYQAQYTG